MNKDQIKGKTREIVGDIQEATGKMLGSKEQRAKGLKKQVSGKTQKAVGDIKESLKSSDKMLHRH